MSPLYLASKGLAYARAHHRDLDCQLNLTYPQWLELELLLLLKVSRSILAGAANYGAGHHALIHVAALMHESIVKLECKCRLEALIHLLL